MCVAAQTRMYIDSYEFKFDLISKLKKLCHLLKDQQMQLTQLVYVSSYIDEFGINLPDFIENSAICNDDLGVRGMTLFSNGNIMQLLEGGKTVVRRIFKRLPMDAYQFQVMELMQTEIPSPALIETSIGFSLHSLRLIKKPPSRIALFRLKPEEVSARIVDSPGKVLMKNFAEVHKSHNL